MDSKSVGLGIVFGALLGAGGSSLAEGNVPWQVHAEKAVALSVCLPVQEAILDAGAWSGDPASILGASLVIENGECRLATRGIAEAPVDSPPEGAVGLSPEYVRARVEAKKAPAPK
jgi:hypothetical protein